MKIPFYDSGHGEKQGAGWNEPFGSFTPHWAAGLHYAHSSLQTRDTPGNNSFHHSVPDHVFNPG